MSDIAFTPDSPARATPSRSVTALVRSLPFERNLMAAGLLLLLLSLPFLMLIATDSRLVDGNATWLKSWKFSLSLGLHLASAALLWRWLTPSTRDGWRGTVLVRLLIATSLFELTYIASQGAIGQGSHFNQGSAYTAIMYSLMGVGAVLLVGSTFAAGVSVLRAPASGRDQVLARAVGLGFALSGFLGLVTGMSLSANEGHFVGIPGDGAAVLPVFGWSREVGDIRVSHFIGLHALQVLPLVGWAAVRLAPARAMGIVYAAAFLVLALSLATLAQALAGLPLF